MKRDIDELKQALYLLGDLHRHGLQSTRLLKDLVHFICQLMAQFLIGVAFGVCL